MQTLINPSPHHFLLSLPCSSSHHHHHHHHHHHKPPIKQPPPSTKLFLNPSCITTDHQLSWRLGFLSGFRPSSLSNNNNKTKLTVVRAVGPDEEEFPPSDESLLLEEEEYGVDRQKELIISEDEARKLTWVERGWAPWEEIFSPESDFARKSLKEKEDLRLEKPASIEAFKMLSPRYRKKRMKESGLTEDQFLAKQFDIQGEILDPLEDTTWTGPMVFRLMPPRDWPPRGWTVDPKELAFIREAHNLQAERLDLKQVEDNSSTTPQETPADTLSLERYKLFLKQYKEWAAANKDTLEKDSYKCDQDYYPGRRRRGKDYNEDMLELPFYYPGQICAGKVTAMHLYHGAFVDIGGVYDGWIPIRDNDWYWIRQHIKVGMHVIVEILAKRDPYRFRFPIEMRFVSPNIDHLVFRRFEFPPIFHREDDTNPDEVRRDCGRPPVPRIDPGIKDEEEPLLSNHPYIDKLWQLHVAEQMILDDEEANPDKYKDKKFEDLTDGTDFNEEDSVEYTQAFYKKSLLPKMIMKTNVKELNMDAARAEREVNNQLRREAEERGEVYKVVKLRRNLQMDEYDLMHWRRSFEEREALIRDISCRQTLGLPLEEPGRYVDESYFGKDRYDPDSPLYRYDYWGIPKNSEEGRKLRRTDAHNASIVGFGTVLDEMSYDEVMKQKMKKEGWEPQSKGVVMQEEVEETEDTDGDEDDDDDDFDYSILGNPINSSNQPVVNGTSSSSLSDDEGMFEN